MKLWSRVLAWLQAVPQSLPDDGLLRRDLKPGTVFRYLYADHVSVFAGYVPPKHPNQPVALPGILIYGESEPGPGDMLTAVEVLWEPN